MEGLPYKFSISAVHVSGDNRRVIRNKTVKSKEEVVSLFGEWVEENQLKNDVMIKVRTILSSDIKSRKEVKAHHILPGNSNEEQCKNLLKNTWLALPEKHRHYAYIVKRLANQWPNLVTWERFLELYREVVAELGGEEEE